MTIGFVIFMAKNTYNNFLVENLDNYSVVKGVKSNR